MTRETLGHAREPARQPEGQKAAAQPHRRLYPAILSTSVWLHKPHLQVTDNVTHIKEKKAKAWFSPDSIQVPLWFC